MRPVICSLLLCAAAFAAGEEVLIQADRKFGEVTKARRAEGFVSFFDDEGTILPKGGDPVTGRAALAPVFQKIWSTPGYSLEWTPLKAVLANSGELGYTYGTYVRKFLKNGEPVTETGKYVTVWKKQPDGSWKVLLDMGISAAPPSRATPPALPDGTASPPARKELSASGIPARPSRRETGS